MKIKLPFTNKAVILHPLFEGILLMLLFYVAVAAIIMLGSYIGFGNLALSTIVFLCVFAIKTATIEEEERNVKVEEE
jgi:hypothetical protein